MTSLSHSILTGDCPSKLIVPNGDLAVQQPRTGSPKPFEQIANTGLLKLATPSRSLQSSSVSTTPKRQFNDDDDKIQPTLSNGFHDPPLSPLRRRRTRGATISEHTEAWDKSFVFSFGMSMLHSISQLQEVLNYEIRRWRCSGTISAVHSEEAHASCKAS